MPANERRSGDVKNWGQLYFHEYISKSKQQAWCSGREMSHEMVARGLLKKDKMQNGGIYVQHTWPNVMSRYESIGGHNGKALSTDLNTTRLSGVQGAK